MESQDSGYVQSLKKGMRKASGHCVLMAATLFLYLPILAAQHALRDLCSPTRYQTQACGSMES